MGRSHSNSEARYIFIVVKFVYIRSFSAVVVTHRGRKRREEWNTYRASKYVYQIRT